MKPLNAREAAFQAVLSSLREEGYAHDLLQRWRQEQMPSPEDYHLAQEIAYGTIRMALALDYLALQLTEKGKISLKVKERALLRTAIYQRVFMDRIPLYALVNETVTIAKRHCHATFVGFLNALLRKLENSTLTLPQGDTQKEISIRASYPEYFVETLISDYGLVKAKEILEAGNQPAITTLRVRNQERISELSPITSTPFAVGKLGEVSKLENLLLSSDFYVQNTTPATLIGKACQQLTPPGTILDLCAAPGGKSIAVHDLFPAAKLFANDVSVAKLRLLEENFKKYKIEATLTEGRGEDYSTDQRFDLIILDVPCSNSGVLNKRPEARWRLSKEALQELKVMQLALIKKASTLLASGGTLIYVTCSILKQENELLIEEACRQCGLKLAGYQESILPTDRVWDGGFACTLKLP